MKKIFTILLTFSLIQLGAQITITSANMPSINDTIRFTNAPVGTFDFKVTGANYNWDYSGLGITNQAVQKFQALSSTPYSTLAFTGMPFGAIGVKQADSVGSGQTGVKNIYNFFDKKTTGWSAVGTGFTLSALPIPAGGVYTDKDEIYTFPLKYNDQDSTTFAVKTLIGNILFSLGYYKQTGYRINKVEGWGTITTPYCNTISCIKIKSRIVETDSLNISSAGLNVGFPNNRVEYKWLSTTEKIPVLEVVGTEVLGTFTPTSIRYRDNYRVSPPSVFGPRVKFSSDKISGLTSVDTFKLINATTPNFGTTYTWTITPSTGVRYVKTTSNLSASPFVVFDNAGVYSVKLSATNFSGTKDSTATNMITITGSGSRVNTIQKDATLFYPNPVKQSLYLNDLTMVNRVCRIYDMTGKLVLEQLVPSSLQVNCEALSKGAYTLVVWGNDRLTIYTEQLVKE